MSDDIRVTPRGYHWAHPRVWLGQLMEFEGRTAEEAEAFMPLELEGAEEQGRADLAAYREAARIIDRITQGDEAGENMAVAGRFFCDYGHVFEAAGESALARDTLARGMELLRGAASRCSDDKLRIEAALASCDCAMLAKGQGDLVRAEMCYRQAAATIEEHVGEWTEQMMRAYSIVLACHAEVLSTAGAKDGAVAVRRRQVEVLQALAGRGDPDHQGQLASALKELGALLMQQDGQADEALVHLNSAAKIGRMLWAETRDVESGVVAFHAIEKRIEYFNNRGDIGQATVDARDLIVLGKELVEAGKHDLAEIVSIYGLGFWDILRTWSEPAASDLGWGFAAVVIQTYEFLVVRAQQEGYFDELQKSNWRVGTAALDAGKQAFGLETLLKGAGLAHQRWVGGKMSKGVLDGVQFDIAVARFHRTTGNLDMAGGALQHALDWSRAMANAAPGDIFRVAAVADCFTELTLLADARGDRNAALSAATTARQLYQNVVQADKNPFEGHVVALGRSAALRALVLAINGQGAEAQQEANSVLKIAEVLGYPESLAQAVQNARQVLGG